MYYSTFHWHPLVNGDKALEAFRSRGTRYIVVHGELLRWQTYREMVVALDERQDVKLVARSPWQGNEIRCHSMCRATRPTATAVSVCRLSALTNMRSGIDTRATNSCAEAT